MRVIKYPGTVIVSISTQIIHTHFSTSDAMKFTPLKHLPICTI